MSTKAFVGYIDKKSKKVKGVHVANDGTLSRVGKTLLDSFKSTEDIEKLVSLGMVWSLADDIGERLDYHSIGSIEERVAVNQTLFMMRDMNYRDEIEILETPLSSVLELDTVTIEEEKIVELLKECRHYVYIWDGTRWLMYSTLFKKYDSRAEHFMEMTEENINKMLLLLKDNEYC